MEPQRPQGVEDSMDKMAVLFTAGFGDRRNSGTMIMRVILTTVPGVPVGQLPGVWASQQTHAGISKGIWLGARNLKVESQQEVS